MKKRLMQLLCLALAIAMVLACTGCKKGGTRVEMSDDVPGGNYTDVGGDAQSDTNNSSGSTDGDNSNVSSGTDSGNKGSGNGGGGTVIGGEKDEVVNKGKFKVHTRQFPIVTDGKLKLTVMWPHSGTADIAASKAAKEFEEKFGIDIEWKSFTYSDIFVVMAAMLQSNNMPDIFFAGDVGVSRTNMMNYGKQGYFADLSNMIATWAPNANGIINKSKALKAVSYCDDGKLYGLPIYNASDAKSAYEERSLMINTDWLDELGLKSPTTVDEFYNVCKEFTENDPDGNGKKDTYGFGIPLMTPQIWNPWGLGMSWYCSDSIDEKGKVHSGPLTENFRAGIRFWNRMWSEGLWNTAMIGNSGTALIQKTGIVSYPGLEGRLSENELSNWSIIPWPKGRAEDCGSFKPGASIVSNDVGGYPNGILISKKTASVEACLRVIDYLYTPEGAMTMQYGVKGQAWTKISDKYKLVKNYQTKLAGNAITTNGWHVPINVGNYMLSKNQAEMNAAEKFTARRGKEGYNVLIRQKYNNYQLRWFTTAEEQTELNKLKNATGSIQWGYDAIQGKVNVETGWNNYVGQYKNYNAWKQIMQKSADRMSKALS